MLCMLFCNTPLKSCTITFTLFVGLGFAGTAKDYFFCCKIKIFLFWRIAITNLFLRCKHSKWIEKSINIYCRELIDLSKYQIFFVFRQGDINNKKARELKAVIIANSKIVTSRCLRQNKFEVLSKYLLPKCVKGVFISPKLNTLN